MELETDGGPARAWIREPDRAPRFLLVTTHGAAGGVDSADLTSLRDAAVAADGVVAAVEQPYRVAGRRTPGGATARQDALWLQTVRQLGDWYPAVPLLLAGRSNGARVACRTAVELNAHAVVALAFPLHPPGKPERSRAAELRGCAVPVLVINGDRDPFGVPDPEDADTLIVRPGERHDLAKDPAGIAAIAVHWVKEQLSLD